MLISKEYKGKKEICLSNRCESKDPRARQRAESKIPTTLNKRVSKCSCTGNAPECLQFMGHVESTGRSRLPSGAKKKVQTLFQ